MEITGLTEEELLRCYGRALREIMIIIEANAVAKDCLSEYIQATYDREVPPDQFSFLEKARSLLITTFVD